jgi:MutL protein
MATSTIDAESILAVEIGSTQTRAALFDVVEGVYHFIASGSATSTVDAPFRDAGECVHLAIEDLQTVTGRKLLDKDSRIIIPGKSNGSGIDRMAMTISAGPTLRVINAGLLDDVSLQSGKNLVATAKARVIENFGLSDVRATDEKIDAIIKAEPDLIILTGGTQQGASRSVLKMVELIMMSCRILPENSRPEIIFAGNRVLAKRIKEVLGKWFSVHTAPNVRPLIDLEDISPAEAVLTNVVTRIRKSQIGGLKQLSKACTAPLTPTPQAFGRVVRFLSEIYNPNKGVMGIDVGASSTTFSIAVAGGLNNKVYPVGLGSSMKNILEICEPAEIIQWMDIPINEESLVSYLWQKSVTPSSQPLDHTAMAIEQAVTRMILRHAMQEVSAKWQENWEDEISFEPILAGGAVLCNAPTPAQSMLMLLDGLQPVGISTIILDQNTLTASLGTIAAFNPVLPVQVLESGAFLNLGTVICPVTKARYGTAVLNIRLEHENGLKENFTIKQGSITSLPLRLGETATIQLDALRGTEIDPNGKRANKFKIVGGVCGAVIDARGRPIQLPKEDGRRRELFKKWQKSLENR